MIVVGLPVNAPFGCEILEARVFAEEDELDVFCRIVALLANADFGHGGLGRVVAAVIVVPEDERDHFRVLPLLAPRHTKTGESCALSCRSRMAAANPGTRDRSGVR